MVQFDQVTLSLAGHTLFEKVSFTLQKGERCGLIGRNGSGKSTLLHLMIGEIEPDQGTISVPKNYRFGYLKQHFAFSQPNILKEAALGLPPQEKENLYKAEKILFGLGFTDEDLTRPISFFSGGYQLRLHLAKVLISEPNCLLLDEPTNYLDIVSIRWLMQFLSRWQDEFILISHDRDFMDQITTHTLGIHRQRMKKIKGSTIDFFEQILQEEEVREKTRLKIEKKREHVEAFVNRFGAKATKAAQAQSKLKMLAKVPVLEQLNALSHLSFSFQEAPFPGKKMLNIENLSFSFTKESLIEHFSLDVIKNERIAIIGKNGRGKSTLLRLIGQELIAKQGRIECSENTKFGYFGQTHVERLDPKSTIEQEITLANPLLNFTQVKTIAGIMMFSGRLSEKKIAILSGGEKSRVLLGKIIAKPCNVLLLDEPTHHLDIESIEALIDALESFSGAIIIITHSELILRRLALNKVIICKEKEQMIFHGNYDEFLEEVGWDDEKTKQPNKKKEVIRVSTKTGRNSMLKKIEKEIQDCETKIIELERKQQESQKLFETNQLFAKELKNIALQQSKLEELNHQLYTLYELYEKKKGEED